MSFPIGFRARPRLRDAVDGPDTSASAGLYARHLSALSTAWRGLLDKPKESPGSTLNALWLHAAGTPTVLVDHPDCLPPLTVRGCDKLERLVRRRIAGVPLAHLTGRQAFLGLDLRAGPEAMIPRAETELLARVALAELQALEGDGGAMRAIDLCTGSGNIALALAHYVPGCEVLAADLCGPAVELARENARRLGLHDRVRFFQGDLFEALGEAARGAPADLVTCNPPYVSSARVPVMPEEISLHEPAAAFDGGRFGLDVMLRLVAQAPAFLKPGGLLCFEVGLGQGEFMAGRMERSGAYREVEGVRCSGEIRVLRGRTAAPS